MRNLLRFSRGYRRESVLAPFFKMLEASFELFVPLVMARIIDVGIAQHDMAYVLKMGGILLLLAAVGLACSLTAQYFAAKASVGFCTALRSELFAHICSLSYSEQDTVGTAAFITRMTSDINQVQSGINLTLRLLLRSPFIVFGAMVMAFTVNVKAAFVFVAAIPLLSLVVFGVMALTMPMYRRVQRQLDQVTLSTRENLTGARVIRAFNRQQDEMDRFEESNSLLVALQILAGKLSALTNPVTYVIVNAAIIAVVWISGREVYAGAITQGETVALVNYMSQILVELVKLANLIVSISKALACADRVGKVFEIKASITEGGAFEGQERRLAPASSPKDSLSEGKSRENRVLDGEPAPDMGKICFRHVYFAYANAKEDSLRDLDFTVFPGQTVGIIGGTGSGKTSLVNLIPRFYDVREGAVYVDGQDVRTFRLSALRGRIGIVPQKAVLFQGTLRDNMRWGRMDASDGEIYHALDIAQAREFVDSKGQGLELEIEQGGRNLSGGQRQRLTIARALVKKPEILIMDDSASALDFATDARLRRAIREETGDMTVFIVSQRAASVMHADQIIVLDDGKMAGKGSHMELMKSCEVYREICLSQLRGEEAWQDESFIEKK